MTEFGVALRIEVNETEKSKVSKNDIKQILDKALSKSSSNDASLALSGQIDEIKELV